MWGAACWAQIGWANGYKLLCLKSTKATALGEAFVVQADDPSAIAFNPAGLAGLRGPQLSLHGTLCNGYTEHRAPGGDTTDIDDTWQFVPAFYATHDFGKEDLAVGFGVSVPNGLSSEWADDWMGRYAATYSDLTVVDYTLSAGVSITDKLQLGVGIDFYDSDVRFDRMVTLGGPDLENTIEGDGTAWGCNLGLTYEVTPKHSVALTYRLPYSIDYSGDISLTGVGTFDMDLTVDFPGAVVAGYAYRPNEKLTVEINLDWTMWEDIDTTQLEVPANPLLSQALDWDYDNTLAYKLGVQYQYSDALALRFGYIYNMEAVPEQTWNPSLPETDMHFFTAGCGYDVNEALTIDAALQVVYYETRTVDNDEGFPLSIDGTYRTWAPCFSVGATYRF